jgi:hypothetical protein
MSKPVERYTLWWVTDSGCELEPYQEPAADGKWVLAEHYDSLLEALLIATSKPLAEHCTDEEWEVIRSALMTAQGEAC